MISHLLAVRKGEDVMSTMTGNRRRAILSGAIGLLMAVGAVGMARADVASDQAGAILIFPKIVVDTSGIFGPPTDTELQVTNASNSVISARCFIVNATSHCNNAPTRACTAESESNPATRQCPSGGICVAQWTENDFRMTLTKRQPISWKASDGLPSFPLDGITEFGPNGQSNRGSDNSPSFIPGVQEDPFFGELKCVEVDPTDFKPTPGLNAANGFHGDLVGHATIVAAGGTCTGGAAPGSFCSQDAECGGTGICTKTGLVDARKYNAIGLQSSPTINDRDDTLLIGGPDAEYNGCPNVLILNHLFDNATVATHKVGGAFTSNSTVTTDLTVIPCGEDFRLQENNLGGATLQFLVFNEFEQRFSTSTGFTCFRELQLSDIDTRAGAAGNAQSIFNVGVQGTLSGQTRIRPVQGPNAGNTILAVTEEFFTCTSGLGNQCTTGANLHFTGTRDLGDQLVLSPDLP